MPTPWAQTVKCCMRRHDMSQSALARRIGVAPQRVQGWVTGALPSIDHLLAFARWCDSHTLPELMHTAYGVPLEDLARGAGAVLLAADDTLDNSDREHLVNQYVKLRELSYYRERATNPPPPVRGSGPRSGGAG